MARRSMSRGAGLKLVLALGVVAFVGGAGLGVAYADPLVVYIPRSPTASVEPAGSSTVRLRWIPPSVEPGVSQPAVAYVVYRNNVEIERFTWAEQTQGE